MDFKKCPVMFSLKYIMGLPVFDEQSSKEELQQNAKVLGTTVHRVLELTKIKDIDDIDNLESNISLAVIENDFEDKELVRKLVFNYFKSSFIREIKDKIIREESEHRFYYKLGNQIIYGIIDKVYYLENKIYLIDFKTNLNFDLKKFESYIPQLCIYTQAIKQREPQKDIISSIFWLREGKSFEYILKAEHIEEVKETIDRIRNIKNKKMFLC